MNDSIKPFVIFIGFIVFWHLLVVTLEIPDYILPGPLEVVSSMVEDFDLLWTHTLVTLSEMFLGLVLGVLFGVALALLLVYFCGIKAVAFAPVIGYSSHFRYLLLRPILMLWFGYGLTSKVVMTMLVIFFPVATCCYDGLRHTHQGWLDMAQIMGGNRFSILRNIRGPAALPALASGLRVAVVVAPIGGYCWRVGWIQCWAWLSNAASQCATLG